MSDQSQDQMDSSEVCDALSCQSPFSCVESLPIFEVWSHSSVTYFLFMLSVCIFPCLQVGDAWREGEGLSLRQPCLPLAPHFMRGSGLGRQGLKGPWCTELLNYCRRGGGVHIDLSVTFIAPRQSSRACSRQVPIQDWEQGSLLSAFAAVPVVSFHVWVVTFTFSFPQYLILTEGNRRWLSGR